MKNPISVIAGALIATALAFSAALGGASNYRFELSGAPEKSAPGTSIVSVKLVHLPDNKPVSGAIVIGEKADMSPIGMGMMTAPVKAMPEKSGVYQFAVQNGSVWKKPDNWSLSIDAKVQGEPQTVHGNVVVKLTP